MYKILSIDGGGMHGYANVVILKRIVEKYPDFLEKADLIAGTSIGGIVGLGFALGHPIEQVNENFIKGFPLAFTTNMLRLAGFYAGLCPKYDNSQFKVFLDKVYGNGATLGDIEKKVVIPAFSLDDEAKSHRRWRAKIFHNFDGTDSDKDVKIVDAAMATSAVPVFFPTYHKYVDGAIVANNPSLVAVAQTQDVRNTQPHPDLKKIAIFSMGTIRDIYIEQRNAEWGYLMWSQSILQMITESDVLVANYIANLQYGERYHRVQPVVNGPIDNFEEISSIAQVGMDYPLDNTLDWINKYWN